MAAGTKLNKKLVGLILAGVLVLLVLFNAVSSPTTRPGLDKGLKLVHKGYHSMGLLNKTYHVFNDNKAPATTPGVHSLLAEHVKRQCQRQGLGPGAGNFDKLQPDLLDHILVDDRYKMLYCNIPKVACTNWRRVMLLLSGKVKVNNVLDISGNEVHGRYKRLIPRLSDFGKAEIQYRLDNYFKFMFVREPFERLLSAWRNKFAGNTNSYFRKQFGRSILKRFRDSADGNVEGSKSLDKMVVHFGEFLQYIVDPVRREALNEHWAKYHRLCHPCQVQYDFVGKYETLDQDAAYVLRSVHADHVVNFPKRSASYKHAQTASALGDYYRNISAALLRHVYRIYKLDFELFDYAVPVDLQWIFNDTRKSEFSSV